MKKECLECGESFVGRSDAKFCNAHCRSSHHNRQDGHEAYVRKVNGILRKNRKILCHLNQEGKKRANRAELEREGFNFNYITNVFQTKAGKEYHFCYDQGYVPAGENWFILVVKHDYV